MTQPCEKFPVEKIDTDESTMLLWTSLSNKPKEKIMDKGNCVRLRNHSRNGYWEIPYHEFNLARRVFRWLTFAPLSDEQVIMLEEWAQTRPNVVWVNDKDRAKADALRELIKAARTPGPTTLPFEGSFSTEQSRALDRLVEAISTSDALFYLDARDTPVPH